MKQHYYITHWTSLRLSTWAVEGNAVTDASYTLKMAIRKASTLCHSSYNQDFIRYIHALALLTLSLTLRSWSGSWYLKQPLVFQSRFQSLRELHTMGGDTMTTLNRGWLNGSHHRRPNFFQINVVSFDFWRLKRKNGSKVHFAGGAHEVSDL